LDGAAARGCPVKNKAAEGDSSAAWLYMKTANSL
jgi:hypothetical protein